MKVDTMVSMDLSSIEKASGHPVRWLVSGASTNTVYFQAFGYDNGQKLLICIHDMFA